MMKKVRKWLPLGTLLTGKWHGGIPRVMETFWILKWVVIMWVYIRVDSHPGVYLRSSHFLHVNYTTGKNIKGCSLTLAGRQLILVWLNTLAPPPHPTARRPASVPFTLCCTFSCSNTKRRWVFCLLSRIRAGSDLGRGLGLRAATQQCPTRREKRWVTM